jgi:HEAT repeats
MQEIAADRLNRAANQVNEMVRTSLQPVHPDHSHQRDFPGNLGCLSQSSRILTVFPIVVFLAIGSTTRADVAKLTNGGELRGKVIKPSKVTPKAEAALPPLITILSPYGVEVSIAKSQVEFIAPRTPAAEEYETRVKRLVPSAEAHWELAEWCRQKGLVKQRQLQLRALLSFEPDHEKAHLGLGDTWHNGEWVNRDELMASQGYFKYKGKYVTQQELDLFEQSSSDQEAEQQWFPKIKLWAGWLHGNNAERRSQAITFLSSVEDPMAASAITRLLLYSPVDEVRLIGVRTLGNLSSDRPVRGLIRAGLLDDNPETRRAALDAIKPAQYAAARPLCIRELRHSRNVVVCRAATALATVGDKASLDPLIDALSSKHRYKVQVPVGKQEGIAFGTDGSFGATGVPLPPDIEMQLRTGQLPFGVGFAEVPGLNPPRRMKEVLVEVTHRNAEVLAALKRLTGQDFGYEERTWRLWLAAANHLDGFQPAGKP